MANVDRAAYLDAVQRESIGLLTAARGADPAAPVPGCPDWTTNDLVWHIGEVHDFWSYVVRERSLAPDYDDPERPGRGLGASEETEALHTFASERAAELHRVLSDADPSTPVWTWTSQQDVAFVLRRSAHETAMHRVDAEHAARRVHRIDPPLAADGIDEFLTFFAPVVRPDAPAPAGSVHIHCTDADGEWVIRIGDDGEHLVTREHAKADTAIRGDAHDVLMALWRRAALDTVDVVGDRSVAEAFVARARNA